MRIRQISEHFCEQLQTDKKTVQRVAVQIVAAPEQFVEHKAVLLQVAQHHALGERAFVPEVIEKTALGDADRGDDFVDRSAGESLGQHGGFRHHENAFARVVAFAARPFVHD